MRPDGGDRPQGLAVVVRVLESGMALEVAEIPFNYLPVSKVEQMEAELRNLSQAELRQIREWLDDLIEDELEFTPEFERSVQQAELRHGR